MAFAPGQGYNFYFGLSATAPTTPADETQGAYNKIGEIAGDISITRSRAMAERRTRDNAYDRFIHPTDRTQSISFVMNLDLTDNAGYQDLQGCYDSDVDGVGATGNLGYWVVTNAVQNDLVWSGIGSPADLSPSIPRDNIITVSVTLESENMTETVHA